MIDVPENPAPPLAVLPREKVHTAARVDTNIRQEIEARFVSGKSRKRIAAEMGLSRNTVAAVIAQAEADGALQGIRDRMAAQMQGVLEDHLLELGDSPKPLSSVDFGIYFDKWQQLTGQATAKIDVVIRREDPSAVFEELRRLKDGIIDITPENQTPPST